MRLSHFEQFAPRCPACVWRARGADAARAARYDCAGLAPLVIEAIEEREGSGGDGGDVIVHGVLRCEEPACGARFPIVDGVPIIVANVRELIARDGEALLRRTDLPSGVEGYIAEAMGPGGAFDRGRLYSGAYAWDHYGVGGDALSRAGGAGGDAVRVLRRLVEMSGVRLESMGRDARVLDVGCATGGVAFEVGTMMHDGLVLGVDVHLGMLRMAQRALRTGVVEYPLRHEGVVYERVRVAVEARRMARAHRVDFWCCDAMAMPIPSGSVDACVGLHTLDAVASPAGLLSELSRVTKDAGRVLLATPFDWTQSVTPMEHWLGGHAAHASHGGDGARVLEWLLGGGGAEAGVLGSGIERMRIIATDDVEWRVRLHARAMTHYRTHLLACEVG